MDAQQLNRELQLKAMTALSNVIGDYERGLISKAQALTGCRAVFDTVGGLVGGPVMDLINQAAQEYRGARGVEVTVEPGASHGLMYLCGTPSVQQIIINGGHLFARTDRDQSVREAYEFFRAKAKSYEGRK